MHRAAASPVHGFCAPDSVDQKVPLVGQAAEHRRKHQRQHKTYVERVQITSNQRMFTSIHTAQKVADTTRQSPAPSRLRKLLPHQLLPRAPILRASALSCNNRITASATPSASLTRTRKPVSPSRHTSRAPSTSNATTGLPQANACVSDRAILRATTNELAHPSTPCTRDFLWRHSP